MLAFKESKTKRLSNRLVNSVYDLMVAVILFALRDDKVILFFGLARVEPDLDYQKSQTVVLLNIC